MTITPQLAQRSYDILYSSLKGRITSKGMSFSLSTFADGSAVIEVKAESGNKTATLKALVTPIYDQETVATFGKYDFKTITGYRITDAADIQFTTNLNEAATKIGYMIQKANTLMGKIR